VSVVAPTRGPAIDAIYATGTVEPTVMLPIAPRVGGRIVELNVDEGSQVRKGQVLARLDDTDLASTVEELQARAGYARSQYQRIANLVRQGFMSQAELDRARADLDAALAAVKRARSQRDYMSLTTPADGLVIRRDGERGQFIPAGQPVFYLSCCAPLRVTAEVDEEDIARVRIGQKVVLQADALPGEVLDGNVAEVTPKGDPIARSYRVRVSLADPSRLKIGMTVDANLIVAERPNALLVPASAVQGNAVWTVTNGRAHRQPVRIGVTGAGRAEIVEGLSPDARIIDSPPSDLREGRAVRPRPPAEGGKK
jgi:RND family efflux transporter MFP subunit